MTVPLKKGTSQRKLVAFKEIRTDMIATGIDFAVAVIASPITPRVVPIIINPRLPQLSPIWPVE